MSQQASLILAKTCLELGQRALVGKINMDDPSQCPEYYLEGTQQGLADTEKFIQEVLDLPGNKQGLVLPVITPRFVPSCTPEMLKGTVILKKMIHFISFFYIQRSW